METTKEKDTSLKSWWKRKTQNKNPNQKLDAGQIFGVPLAESVDNARAAIAYADDNVQYMGYIPLLIAKCGSFLKEEALYTEGIFRMSGSAKRIGELQQIFNTPPDYGRQLDWKGYSVHDTANVLRRYLNYLPEPVIIQELCQSFQQVIDQPITDEQKVNEYQRLIEQLPQMHQFLLFYLLDLLFLFSQNAHITRMDTFNLASVFTPGILIDPECSMDPAHYKTSQRVVQFLIEHQLCFQMPRSSLFRRSTEDQTTTTTTTSDITKENTSSSSPSSTYITPLQQSSSQQPLFVHTPNNLHPSLSSSTKHSPTSAYSKDDHTSSLHRSKTLPVKRSKYGGNDPLQVVQFNKPIIDSA
ncbi:Rho GTPase activation protein [Halteromyces radiatus]|uniref:Rho GTPase activation protein n=1 Tax=Halteromyces radiatus TaxID=101107 RepID=UPI002220485C|nr:Rho GTPase activation protein [Halteromyces radiatus]KAI8097783.1 Rho GTPase activation protein [Halteromyces radiatus]